jgi:SPW repeat
MRGPETGHVMLAGWAILSSWMVGFSGTVAASGTSVLGAAIVAFAGIAVLVPEVCNKGSTALMASALLVSPWVLDADAAAAPTTHTMIVGLLVVSTGVWAVAMNPVWVARLRRWK